MVKFLFILFLLYLILPYQHATELARSVIIKTSLEMSHQPWLEDLPDDWVSTPGTPTSPSPPQAINDSRPSTGQNSPSRIPVPARRPAQQSPASEGKKKITRPCHFIKREPPTPKSPRSPNTPSKLRSPVPSKSKKSPKPSPAAARKQQPPVDTRSPLRSVSNVSSQSAPQNTVQVRPKQGREDETTPEYRKRLVHGGIPASEQRDLFAPIGLESVFNPPSPGLETAQHEQIPMGKNQDDTVSAEEGPGESYDWNEGDPTAGLGDGDPIKKHLEVNHDSYRKNTTISWDLPNPSLEVREKANQSRSRDVSHNNTFQRTASGLEDLRNEGITPITFSRSGTVHGNSTSEVIQSALKQVTDKLGHLSLSPGCRPDSRASDSMLFHQHSEHPDDVFSEDDLLDTTSQSLPQDLSMGTQESAVRRAFSNYRREQHLGDGFFHSEHPTPSPFPSQRRPRSALANSRIQSSPSFLEKERPTDPPTLPRSPSHVRTSVTQDSEDLDTNAMPSSGSPLKLFGNHDTFTNNKLLRRMSQFEETFGDLSEDEEPVSPSEEARRKGEIRGFLNVQQGTPRGPSMRRNERSRSRNGMHLRMSRFGNGQLDNFDFSDTSPYEPKLPYDEPTNHDIRLPLRSRSADGRRYHSQSSYRDFSPGSRSTYSNVRRNASSGDYRPASSDAVFASRLGVDGEDDLNITGKERSSNTRGKSPTPKRRKTILRPIGVDKENQAFEGSATQFSESMSLLKKSLIQHGVDYDDEMALRPPSTQRPRNPTPAQARSTPGKGDSPSRNRPKPDSNDWGAPGSLSERPLPMVKVTDANDERRKGSITTQDFLSEATKIMDIIRAKGKNGGGLPDVEEFDIDHEHNDGDYEDESTLDDFVRPPSREGVDVRKLRAQKEPDPRVLSHLRKFQENEDLEFGVSASFSFDKVRNTASGGETGGGLGGIPNDHQLQEDAMDARKRKYSAPFSNDDDSRNLSARSIPTGSSQSSHAKGVLSSDLVSHLIPEQVNGLTYDRLKHQWVKERARRSRQSLGTPRTDDSEEDPFRDIPDLSVDELQEMMGIQPYSPEKTKDLTAAEAEDSYESPISPRTSRKPELQPQAKDGEHSADASTVQSKATRYTSSIPNSGTRATSWDTDPSKRKDSTSEVEHEIQLHEGRFSRPPKSDDSNHQARVVTISFSSPLVSHVAYSDDPSPARSGVQTRSPHGRNKKPQRLGDGSYRSPNRSPVFPPRRTPIKGQQFIRRPVSRIDERNEDTMEDLSLARQNSTFPNECTENNDRTEASLVRSVERRMSYSFHLSPLPDFTVDQIDQSLHLEMSYVAERTHPSSLRQIHGTFALATEKLVKHITDAAPSELYWDYIRRLILREKGLFTLHKLNEFCPHLEDLDVSDNDIGQVSGVPCSLRTLKIQRNCLTNLTAWGHLINLQYLDVSGNHLESLDGFGGLIHLRELKANDNKIRSIDGIFDLNGLLSLKLSNNSLAAADFESSDL